MEINAMRIIALDHDYKEKLISRLLYLLLMLCFVFLFYPLFLDLIGTWWSDPEFSHGFLIPLISGYMIFQKRIRIKESIKAAELFDLKNSKSAFLFLIIGLFIYTIGRYVNDIMVEGISFIIVLWASILFIYGVEVFKLTGFPIGYLLFMIPLPARVLNFFSEPLKYMVAWISATIISSFNIPVFLEKEMINLPSVTLQVEEACSGIRTILAFSAIGLFFAHLFIRSSWFKAGIVILAVCIAVIINVARISAIGIIAYFFNNDAGLAIHRYGWTVTSFIGFLIIFLTARAINARN